MAMSFRNAYVSAAARARDLAELAARKRRYEEHRDEELERCVIAYAAHRVNGGQQRWEDFRREWYLNQGGQDGR